MVDSHINPLSHHGSVEIGIFSASGFEYILTRDQDPATSVNLRRLNTPAVPDSFTIAFILLRCVLENSHMLTH